MGICITHSWERLALDSTKKLMKFCQLSCLLCDTISGEETEQTWSRVHKFLFCCRDSPSPWCSGSSSVSSVGIPCPSNKLLISPRVLAISYILASSPSTLSCKLFNRSLPVGLTLSLGWQPWSSWRGEGPRSVRALTEDLGYLGWLAWRGQIPNIFFSWLH